MTVLERPDTTPTRTDNQASLAVPPARQRPTRRVAWLMLPVLLLTAWLGARSLNVDALWYDEWLSVYYAGGAHYGPFDLTQTWARVADNSTWPPGFQSLLAVWVLLTGSAGVTMRALPLLTGVLAVAALYRLGSDLSRSRRVGLAAALIFGTGAFFVYYLHELRAYSLYALMVIAVVWSYWRLHQGRRDRPTQSLLVLSIAGTLYTHYFAALVVPALALHHLLVAPHGSTLVGRLRSPAWWRLPLLMAVGTLLFLPWWGVAFDHAAGAFVSEERRIIPLDSGAITTTLLTSFSNANPALLALMSVFALLPLVRRRDPQHAAVRLVTLWLVVALTLGLLLNERLRVIFHVRHLLVIVPALALLVAFGVDALARTQIRRWRRLTVAALLVVWGANGVWQTLDGTLMRTQPGAEPTIPWATLGPVLDRLNWHTNPDDRVVLHVAEPGREWLTEPVVDFYLRDFAIEEFIQHEQIPGLPANNDYFNRAARWLGTAPRVWTIVRPDVPSPYHVAEFERVLADDYVHCGRPVDLPTMQVDLYALTRDDTNRMDFFYDDHDIKARLLNRIPAHATGYIPVTVGLLVGESVPPNTYSVGLHVENPAGELVAQVDFPLPGAGYTCAWRDVAIDDLPPGDYTVNLLLYDWQTGARLTGRDTRTTPNPTGGRLQIGSFTRD